MTETAPANWPRRPRRLATVVVDELVDRLVSGELAADQPLPTEPLLCQTFGVSRTVIREAIKSLEGMQLVTAQQGQGTRVRPLADWDLLDPTVLGAVVRHDADNAILEDLVDVRRALESQMAGQAARQATPEALALITERMQELDETLEDTAAYLRADVAFHDAIHAASGNRLGRAIIRKLTVEAYRSLRYVGHPSQEHVQLTHEAHRLVHDAVLSGDEAAAEKAMDEHILESWQRRRPADED
jgi:GntR family galactonate operon transcriptional repressor